MLARRLQKELFITSDTSLETADMTAASHQTFNSNDELPKDLIDLTVAVADLPTEQRARLEPILTRVVESTKRRRRILNLVQEALSQLRLDMKYLVFDLEATRRERDALRSSRDDDQHAGEE